MQYTDTVGTLFKAALYICHICLWTLVIHTSCVQNLFFPSTIRGSYSKQLDTEKQGLMKGLVLIR